MPECVFTCKTRQQEQDNKEVVESVKQDANTSLKSEEKFMERTIRRALNVKVQPCVSVGRNISQ